MIADSSAFQDPERLLPQHQAALTVLQSRLSAPNVTSLSWLDLACGRGQIILSLDSNLSQEARHKIAFWAYDLDHRFARDTQKAAELLDFASLRVTVGDLSDFDRILPAATPFDFITLTNTVHEIAPVRLATLIAACIGRLADAGTLFIYDLDSITPPELGAVPWSRDDMRRIVRMLLDALGASAYRPEIGLWNHRTCNGWNVQIERQHLGVSRIDMSTLMGDAIEMTSDEVGRLLQRRLSECHASLETLTKYGPQTGEERSDKERLLHEFWALSRALGRTP